MRTATALLAATLGCATTPSAPEPAIDCRQELERVEALQSELRGRALGGPSARAQAELRIFAQLDDVRARWSDACHRHRTRVIDARTYADEIAELRDTVERAWRAVEMIDGASDDGAWNAAFVRLYEGVVPETEAQMIELDVAVSRRGGASTGVLADSARLHVGDSIRIQLEMTGEAYLYVYMRSPAQQIKPLFPHLRIPVRNPVSAGAVTIPPSGAYEVDQQIGPVQITVIAATRRLEDLETVLALGLDATSEQVECVARGEPLGGDCRTSRGMITVSPAGNAHIKTLPGERRAVHVFTFEQSGP